MQSRASPLTVAVLVICALCARVAIARLTPIAGKPVKKIAGKVAVKPKALKFGKVTHIATLQFNIQNSGTAPISGSIGRTGSTAFTIVSGGANFGPINPGDAYAVTVQFAPKQRGSFASAVTIASNAQNAKVKVAVSGSAQNDVTTPTPTPSPTASPTPSPTPAPTPTPIVTPSIGLGGAVTSPYPISNAQVTAWAIGNNGYGQGALALACVTTDATAISPSVPRPDAVTRCPRVPLFGYWRTNLSHRGRRHPWSGGYER